MYTAACPQEDTQPLLFASQWLLNGRQTFCMLAIVSISSWTADLLKQFLKPLFCQLKINTDLPLLSYHIQKTGQFHMSYILSENNPLWRCAKAQILITDHKVFCVEEHL